jgi:hypothetical protein
MFFEIRILKTMFPAYFPENAKIYILNNTIVTNDEDVKHQFQRRKHDMVCPEHFLSKFFPSMATANCVFGFDGMDPNKRYISVRSQELSHLIHLENSKNGIVDFEPFRDGVTMMGLGVTMMGLGVTMMGLGVGLGMAGWGLGPILMRRLVVGKIRPTGFKVLNPVFHCIYAKHVTHLAALCRVQPMEDSRGRRGPVKAASSTHHRNERALDAGTEGAALNTAAAHSPRRDAPTWSTPPRALAAPAAPCAVTRTSRRVLCAAAPPVASCDHASPALSCCACHPRASSIRAGILPCLRPACGQRPTRGPLAPARAPSSICAGYLSRRRDASAGQFGRRPCGRPAGRRPARNPARGVSGPPETHPRGPVRGNRPARPALPPRTGTPAAVTFYAVGMRRTRAMHPA